MKIIWTEFAIKNLKAIFEYYSAKGGKQVAHKIRKQILNSVKQLVSDPNSGQLELNLEEISEKYRYLVVGNYKLIYRVIKNQIVINDVFHTKQNPFKINDENRNV
ncbi:MAG TPA: type II toxin-antitoxin system RelE/ParE family toxin [Flavobacterium sp.]|nr:type II toxin-antitoxin system RelE/ParE family toxin [Flavobacterium sp.]